VATSWFLFFSYDSSVYTLGADATFSDRFLSPTAF